MSSDSKLVATVLLTALLLAACGSATTPSTAPTSTAAPSAASATASVASHPAAVAIAVRETTTGTVLFLRADGTVIGQTKDPGSLYVAGAAGKLWYIDLDGHLRTVGVDGGHVDMGLLQGLGIPSGIPSGLAVTADGRSWAWGECVGCDMNQGRMRVFIAGIGVPARMVLDEPSSNQALVPLAWTARGIAVTRNQTGLGGCCYLTPEQGGRAVVLIDPSTLKVSATWNGCGTTFVSATGSFACLGTRMTVHLSDGLTRSVTPTPPVAGVGWVHVDDAGNRVVFAVIHSRGHGDGGCTCVIDTESAALNTGVVTKIADQVTPDGLLADGRVLARSAPASPGGGIYAEWLLSSDGTRVQLGPDGAELVAVIPPG